MNGSGGSPEALAPAPPPELVRWLAEGTHDLVAAVDEKLRYTGFNRAYREEFLGTYGALPEVGGEAGRALPHMPDVSAAIEDSWRRAIAGEEFTVIEAHGDGMRARKLYEVSRGPLRDVSGRIVGAGLLARDVTAREEARAALERSAAEMERRVTERTAELSAAVERLKAADGAKSRFLGIISHELRTPLTAIVGYTDLLESEVWGPLQPRQREQIGRIHAATWHIVSIIDDILTFARTEEGRDRVRLEETNIVRLAYESTDMVAPQAAAKGLVVRTLVPRNPILARTDPGKLRQILINVVGNAVKFTDSGEVVLEVLPGAEDIVVRVSDTGPGIAADRLEAIFEPFTQLENSAARGGTGLGLTVSRRLARLLDGDLTVSSRRGEGSVFMLRLPSRRT